MINNESTSSLNSMKPFLLMQKLNNLSNQLNLGSFLGTYYYLYSTQYLTIPIGFNSLLTI